MGFYGGGTKGEEKEIMRVTLLGSFANLFYWYSSSWRVSGGIVAL